MKTNARARLGILITMSALWASPGWSSTTVYLTEVPDYEWFYGCMGTAAGNLMGYWDRHGFPDFYTGPVNGGLAPLKTTSTNIGIVSMWASRAGFDGRPTNQFGHVDDFYVDYESTARDPYLTAGRAPHSPDCIGDFIGLSQMNWTNMAGECNGNIDAYCFVYWNTNGDKLVDFQPGTEAGSPATDVQSGLRAWTQYRGYDCSVFSQLVDLNPNIPDDNGFTYDNLKAEIDAGYPVILFLQKPNEISRTVDSATNVNPIIHSMLAYGYYISNTGARYVKYMTSWASGPNMLSLWSPQSWQAGLPVRGVIGFHPLPKITRCAISDGNLFLQWDGPASNLYDSNLGTTNRVHGYVVEMSASLETPSFSDVSSVLSTNSFTVTNSPSPAFFRLRLVKP